MWALRRPLTKPTRRIIQLPVRLWSHGALSSALPPPLPTTPARPLLLPAARRGLHRTATMVIGNNPDAAASSGGGSKTLGVR